MKLERRLLTSPETTVTLWMIPTLFYGFGKLFGTKYNEYEWVWWFGIPVLFLSWVILNFKLVRRQDGRV